MKEETAELANRSAETPTQVESGQLGEGQKFQALDEHEKLPLDLIRMICHHVETRPTKVVMEKWNTGARGIVSWHFRSEADIIPERDNDILRVRTLGSAGRSDDVVAAEFP